MARVLYEMAASPNAKRARLGLVETGESFELLEVNLMTGEQKLEEYKKIHPFGRIPALDDDGTVVWESGAILLYLAEFFGIEIDGFDNVAAWMSAMQARPS